MYLTHDEHFKDRFSPFGLEAFECHYQGAEVAEIESFLNDVVIKGNDPKYQQRNDFFNRHLLPSDGVLPSQKIIMQLENIILNKPI